MGVSCVSAGGYHHHIGLNTWRGQSAPPAADGALGLRYFQVVLPDGSELKRLTNRLEQANLSGERNEDGVLGRDPSHNVVLLTASQNPER